MRIHQVAGLLVHALDRFERVLFRAPVGGKAFAKFVQRFFRQSVHALFLQVAHPAAHNRVVAPCELKEQPLQIGGNEDIDRAAHALIERALVVVHAARKEVREHVVAVGGADELVDRQSHPARVFAREDIAKVACRHAEVDALARTNRSALQKRLITRVVIHNLRQESSKVDGVRTRKPPAELVQFGSDFLRRENLLDRGLRVVKVAAHGADVHIAALLGDHLEPLCFRYSPVRVEHQNARAGNVLKPFQRGFAGIAGSGNEDIHPLLLARLPEGLQHQVRQHLQGYVLKRHGRPVPEFQHGFRTGQLYERRNFFCVKTRVSGADHAV
ncbi:hypothetical protein SDC9_54758 [bioreactor metagenome]|uniref:Uncharacterized protein n=1 Tax=bioreactor metagenome TaxID=1076179 RepID=A0A644WX08_9ZZZZ